MEEEEELLLKMLLQGYSMFIAKVKKSGNGNIIRASTLDEGQTAGVIGFPMIKGEFCNLGRSIKKCPQCNHIMAPFNKSKKWICVECEYVSFFIK